MFIASIAFFSASAKSKANPGFLLHTGSGYFRVTVVSAPSTLNGAGAGFCGAGEEITLNVYGKRSKKPLFSKLIESCLKDIELLDGELGSETREPIARALRFNDAGVEIQWLSVGGRGNVTGHLDLTSGKPVYHEITGQPAQSTVR